MQFQSYLFESCFFKLKKGKDDSVFSILGSYGRFLSTRIVIAKHMAIATMIPATAGTKYMSATDSAGACVGAGVGAAASTTKAAASCDGQ